MAEDNQMSVLQHLEELRRILIVSIVSLIPATILAWFFKENIMGFLVRPLREKNPDFTLNFFGPTEAFFVFLKLSIAAGFLIALPIILYQVWKFVLPALKSNEKKVLYTIVPLSFILFIGGIAFAYFTVFKVALFFFLSFGGEYADPMLRLSDYLSFVLTFLLPFGLVFQLPVVILFLTRMKIITPKFLAQKRKYAIFIIVLVSTVLTPPDIVSQVLMSVPVYLLYEISIWISYLFEKKRKVSEG